MAESEPWRIRSIPDALVAGCGDVAIAEGAVTEGALHGGLALGEGKAVDSVTPMMIVHRDYVDSAPFLAEVREVRAGGRGADSTFSWPARLAINSALVFAAKQKSRD